MNLDQCNVQVGLQLGQSSSGNKKLHQWHMFACSHSLFLSFFLFLISFISLLIVLPFSQPYKQSEGQGQGSTLFFF